jgi:peptidoglycan/LPS O-acetylase OafA/YrhL
MTNQTGSTARQPLLDGMRGIAAFCVMLGHVRFNTGYFQPLEFSYLFVDYFFLLSGFVLTLGVEHKIGSRRAAWGFIKARAVRFWPMVVAGALIGALVYGMKTDWSAISVLLFLLVTNAFMIPAPVHGRSLFELNVPQWSLMYELLANVAHALVLRHLSEAALLRTAIVLGGLLAFWITVYGTNDLGAMTSNVPAGLTRVGFAYVLGIWMARRRLRVGEPTRSFVPWWVALLLPVALIMLIPGFADRALAEMIFAIAVIPLTFALLINEKAPAALAPVLSWMGALSFPLYAIHQPILSFATIQFDGIWTATFAISASVALAQVLAITIEARRKKPVAADKAPAPARNANA